MINAKWYGLVGNGKHNDYPAFEKLIAFANANGGGDFFFPRGTYYLGDTGLPYQKHLIFENCDGLNLVFEAGASISLKANFVHSSSRTSPGIELKRCSNVKIDSMEVNGNVSTGTKVGTEQGEMGIHFYGCSTVTLINCSFHDNPNDGLYIDHLFSGTKIVSSSENFVVINTECFNNGRQGMSIIGLFGGTFTNCTFNSTGNTGPFGAYAPGAGVDIEPNLTESLLASDIDFFNCTFEDNIGACFVTAGEATETFDGRVNRVWLYNCKFVVTPRALNTDQIITGIMDGGIIGGSSNFREAINLDNPRITAIYSNHHSGATIQNHVVYGRGQFLYASKDKSKSTTQQKVYIRNCRFICINETPYDYYRLYIDAGGEYTGNYLFINGASYGTGPETRNLVKLLTLDRVSDNTYDTDMTTKNQKFTVDYSNSRVVTHEKFLEPSSFFSVNHSTDSPMNATYGEGEIGSGQQITLWDIEGNELPIRFLAGSSFPKKGTWRKGDRVYNDSPSAGDVEGWICISDGSPGQWKSFGSIQR